MSNREEQREFFDRQMRAWSAKQGVWHQLTGSGGNTITFRLLKLATSCLVLLVVAAIVTLIYTVVRVEGDDFKMQVEQSLAKSLYADEVQAGAISRSSGVASISKLDFTGSEYSFFDRAAARHVSFQMKALNGLVGEWHLGVIRMQSLDIDVKSGGVTDDHAGIVYQLLFEGYDQLAFSRIEVTDASFSWGYTEQDRGEVRGSKLIATRDGDTWELEFVGGEFSFHWLNHVPIEYMSVTCGKMGVVIKDARLYSGEGKLDLNANIAVASMPKVTGSVKMSSMPTSMLLPEAYRELISGSISANGSLSGALNSEHSVLADFDVTLDEKDRLDLLETVPLLEALSIIDSEKSYRKFVFDRGGFHLRSSGEEVEYSDINLHSASDSSVTGGFKIQPPSHAEIAQRLGIELEDVQQVMVGHGDFLEKGNALAGGVIIDDSLTGSFDAMQKTTIIKEGSNKSYSGSLRLALHPKAFDKTLSLSDSYPVDATEGRAVIEVALEGPFSSLTKELCEELYRLGKAKN